MTMDYIRSRYGVPAAEKGRVIYNGNKAEQYGTIIDADGARLRIQLDGQSYVGTYHPTWELTYLDAHGHAVAIAQRLSDAFIVADLRRIADREPSLLGLAKDTMRDAARRIEAAGVTIVWHPMDQPPAVEIGADKRVLAAWRIRASGETTSGEIYYLNKVYLDWGEEHDGMDKRADADGKITGWFERYEARDGDICFEPLSDQFVEHLGWTDMPVMQEAAHG